MSEIPLLEKYKDLIYLDNAATTQKPREILEAVQKFYEESNANVHRGIYTLAQRATLAYEKAREIVAQFIGARTEEIIFTRGTTESMNLLAVSLGKKLREGDEILLTEMEHHSNLVPWQQLAKEKGLLLKFIPITAEGLLDLHAAKKLMTERTKIVSVTHLSNVLGTINPVQELAACAHAVGALVVVDAAQSVPHMPLVVEELGCDFLAFSGHKMCGPMGIGVLWGKKELLEAMEPFQYGGEMIEEVHFTEATWNAVPWKFEAGTPHVSGAIGLAAAVQYLQKKSMAEIKKQGEKITAYALQKLSAFPEIEILGPLEASKRGPLVSFVMKDLPPHDVAEICDRYHIAVRAGYQCAMPLHKKLGLSGSVRASFYFYNTEKDIDALLQALHQARKVFHD